MLNKKLEDAMNDQLNYELFSSYVYLSMAAYLESVDFPGAANWMRLQAREEVTHAMKFFDFINEREGRVRLQKIDQPPLEWDSTLAAFQHAFEHEQGVSKRIGNLVDLARKEKDHAAEFFLQWFVTEQVEEEASVKAIVQQLKMIGDAGHGLFMLDRELGKRQTSPAAESESEA